MIAKIESYDKVTRELMNIFTHDLYEYSLWVARATKRGYEFSHYGKYIIVQGGSGTRDFVVSFINI